MVGYSVVVGNVIAHFAVAVAVDTVVVAVAVLVELEGMDSCSLEVGSLEMVVEVEGIPERLMVEEEMLLILEVGGNGGPGLPAAVEMIA